MLRVISRPMTVPAERMALLNAGLSIICSSMVGSAFSTGAGIGGRSRPVGIGGRSIDSPAGAGTPSAAGGGAIFAASIS